ncbi:glycerophosphodiester phosphodiesterase [Brevibacterium samyangense]|uniref:Glycerophosphodiester phosphodiesterase family protein n=1 Tax=Brevibacterium samyangense TaxID=366888 RepID=A0ABN2TG03_9MICO
MTTTHAFSPIVKVAHRGASFEAPENTRTAFRRAIEQGADLIETDVHRTADGVLVLVHDDTLERTTNVREVFPGRTSYAVADFTWDELQQLDAGSWKGTEFAGERIPSLAQFLDLLQGCRTGLLLEVKDPTLYPGMAADLVAVLEASEQFVEPALVSGKLIVQSFHWDFVREFHALMPAVPVGYLALPEWEPHAEDAAWLATYNPYYRAASPELMERVHELGMRSFPWTVNEPEEMHAVLDAGADGIITDKPLVLEQVVREREARAAGAAGAGVPGAAVA